MRIVSPLAQSFYVDNESGVFVTGVDLYFASKDANLPVTIQLRPMKLGLPAEKIYPFSEVVLDPSRVLVSDNAAFPTRVTFESPVYLEGNKFHALVITSNSIEYNVWVSRLGEVDITTAAGPESKKVVVAKQPISGGLFKSQNASTWNESPYEDLKFTLYRSNFVTNQLGSFNFYNPELNFGNNQIATLLPNSLEFTSKRIRVGLGSTVQDNGLVFGNTISQHGSNATGNYVNAAGIATGNLTIVNAGVGYTPSSGSLTFAGVALTSITGSGLNATANITITNGVAVAATISNGGTGYVIGDVLTATQIGSEKLGQNLQLSVQGLRGINELILDNVQGDFVTGAGKTVRYTNSLGITTDLNGLVGGNVLIQSGGIREESDGLHIKVNHKNHGMHAGENIVRILNVLGDTKPIKLTADYEKTSTASIPVDSTVNFTTFENVGISSTNPGYILIGNEIIAYEGTTANSLTGITREIDQTLAFKYTQGTPIYKYEINGISLRRINTTHTLQDATVSDPSDFDYYTLKIDTSQDGKTAALPYGQVDRSVGTSFPKLYINQTKSTGGEFINATQNIQYEIARPNIQTFSLNGTNISADIRTVSGTSVDGSENSFEDKGFSSLQLNANNYFDSPRLICSKLNEQERLGTLPGNKSLTVNLSMESFDSFISPVVDLDRVSMIFVTNRINNPITNYKTDNRVNTLEDDPSSFVYATNTIQLEIPATSIKVIVSAYVNIFSDLRALYAIKNQTADKSVYSLFPGYSVAEPATRTVGREVKNSLSDGTPDKKMVKSSVLGYDGSDLDFIDYEFTVSDLSPFKYFSIKLIGSGTNQAFPPRLKDLRVIAVA